MNGPTSGSTQQAGTEFIALSRFTIANGMVDQVKDAFINRPHLVDTARGFLRMQVITPSDDRREIWLFTGVVQNQPFLGHRGRTKATGP